MNGFQAGQVKLVGWNLLSKRQTETEQEGIFLLGDCIKLWLKKNIYQLKIIKFLYDKEYLWF